MKEFKIREETIHYAAHFLERWEEKNPVQGHLKAQKDLRELSDFLLEQLQTPVYGTIIRKRFES